MCMIAYVQGGATALYIASQGGHGPVVKLLLQTEHADISICEKVSPYILILYLPPILLPWNLPVHVCSMNKNKNMKE